MQYLHTWDTSSRVNRIQVLSTIETTFFTRSHENFKTVLETTFFTLTVDANFGKELICNTSMKIIKAYIWKHSFTITQTNNCYENFRQFYFIPQKKFTGEFFFSKGGSPQDKISEHAQHQLLRKTTCFYFTRATEKSSTGLNFSFSCWRMMTSK